MWESLFGTGGGAAAGGAAGGGQGLFLNPGFLNFLAGTGASLDPNGVGGAIGTNAQQWIQSQQMAQAAAKQDQKWAALIQAIGGTKGKKISLSSNSQTGKSTVSIDGTNENAEQNQGLGKLDAPIKTQTNTEDSFSNWLSQLNKFTQMYGGK